MRYIKAKITANINSAHDEDFSWQKIDQFQTPFVYKYGKHALIYVTLWWRIETTHARLQWWQKIDEYLKSRTRVFHDKHWVPCYVCHWSSAWMGPHDEQVNENSTMNAVFYVQDYTSSLKVRFWEYSCVAETLL